MRLRILLSTIGFLWFIVFSCPVSRAAELAKVGDGVITSDEFVEEFRYAQYTSNAPERTFDGKKEFLDRIIAKHLISHYIRSHDWDTLAAWNNALLEYEQSIYLQTLYRDAIPEARRPWTSNSAELMRLGNKYVDSLITAYDLHLEGKAIKLMADKSLTMLTAKAQTDPEGRPVFKWSGLFTDEDKKVTIATFAGGQLTIGELVREIDRLPIFARPTAGNGDQISDTVQHFTRETIFREEFKKKNLRQDPWFLERMTSKQEEFIADRMFSEACDTAVVTDDEARKYYEGHKDDYLTLTAIKIATISMESEEHAREVAKEISGGKSFESVAVDFSVFTHGATGFDTTDFFDRSKLPAVYDAIWDKQIGEVVGPVNESETWVVAKLLGRENPRLLPFEEAKEMVVEKLKLSKAADTMARLIADQKSKVPITIDYAALEKLELPKSKSPE